MVKNGSDCPQIIQTHSAGHYDWCEGVVPLVVSVHLCLDMSISQIRTLRCREGKGFLFQLPFFQHI